MDTDIQSGKRKKRKYGKYDTKKREWFRTGKWFIGLVVLFVLLFRFVIGFSVISGCSMNNTLQDGDNVIFTRINFELHRGDVVAAHLPDGEYNAKRIIAVAGDVVDLRDGVIYINGKPETGDYYIGPTLPEEAAFTYPYTVEENTVFLLGDNRVESKDSRFYGSVSTLQVTGVIHARYGWFFLNFL